MSGLSLRSRPSIWANDAVTEHRDGENPLTYGEVLFALRVCAAVVVSDIPEAKRQDYVQQHLIGSAEMLGVPIIPMEVDAPDKSEMN